MLVAEIAYPGQKPLSKTNVFSPPRPFRGEGVGGLGDGSLNYMSPVQSFV